MTYLGCDLVSPNFWSGQITDLAWADYSKEGGNFLRPTRRQKQKDK